MPRYTCAPGSTWAACGVGPPKLWGAGGCMHPTPTWTPCGLSVHGSRKKLNHPFTSTLTLLTIKTLKKGPSFLLGDERCVSPNCARRRRLREFDDDAGPYPLRSCNCLHFLPRAPRLGRGRTRRRNGRWCRRPRVWSSSASLLRCLGHSKCYGRRAATAIECGICGGSR